MPILPGKCPSCGADIQVDGSQVSGICKYCGSSYYVERAINQYYTTTNNNFIIQNAVINKSATSDTDQRKQTRIERIVYYVTKKQFFDANKEIEAYQRYWPMDVYGSLMSAWETSFVGVKEANEGYTSPEKCDEKANALYSFINIVDEQFPDGWPVFYEPLGLQYKNDIINNFETLKQFSQTGSPAWMEKEKIRKEKEKQEREREKQNQTIAIKGLKYSFIGLIVGIALFGAITIAMLGLTIHWGINNGPIVISGFFLAMNGVLSVVCATSCFVLKKKLKDKQNEFENKYLTSNSFSLDGNYANGKTNILIHDGSFIITSNGKEINNGKVKENGDKIVLFGQNNKKMTLTKNGTSLISINGTEYRK